MSGAAHAASRGEVIEAGRPAWHAARLASNSKVTAAKPRPCANATISGQYSAGIPRFFQARTVTSLTPCMSRLRSAADGHKAITSAKESGASMGGTIQSVSNRSIHIVSDKLSGWRYNLYRP